MLLDVPFPADYHVELITELPAGGVDYDFRSASSVGTDIYIQAYPISREPWVGAVARPSPAPRRAVTAVHPTPRSDRVCVIAGGDAYRINVERPEVFETIATSGPVVSVHPLLSHALLLLVSPWAVTAVDDEGVAWRTERLAIEQLRLDEVMGERLAGVADPDDEARDFVIELSTGRHQGGVPFR